MQENSWKGKKKPELMKSITHIGAMLIYSKYDHQKILWNNCLFIILVYLSLVKTKFFISVKLEGSVNDLSLGYLF
ncbi:hypothetical protein RCL_jg12399.t1 [Rhizophagus clarus]|uniref:Uncharacterized protein n=1 Tax=Rhizophagus clarus TaxID=94130 RepID=A0A8H3L1D9_9GLOM|nr:hypothetical protein RCL_jg12399.t1 [Rhizophagus clarus]